MNHGAGQNQSGQALRVAWSEPACFAVPVPPDEDQRIAALAGYEILDTPPERDFDDITLLAAQICDAPIALITLVDPTRQWFKSKVGVTLNETRRDLAFCAHAIMGRDVFVVQDAASDPRFANHPFVRSEPFIRFYAGAPLITPDNHALGTLCVIDRVPRELTQEQIDALQALSRQVMVQLELRRSLGDKLRVEQALRASEQKWLHVLEQTHDLIAWITPAGRFVSVNRAWLKALGYTERDITNMAFQDVVEVHSLPQWREAFDRALSGQLAGPLELSLQAKSGRPVFVQGNLHCDYEAGQPASLLGIFRNVSELKRLEAEAGRSPAASSVATANQICTFDPQVLMIGLHGRMDVLQELAAVFERDSPAMLERIRQAIQAQDADALEEAAHKLKGAISMFRADAAMNLAVTLEKLGARNNFTGASEILSRLGDETGALIRDLKILLAAPPAKDKSG